ncbi:MAG TPA: hypothetical protein VLE72_03560 [Candidatus Saccharimonadales bacterium]|nr:hypothetical protein [Candidatus Saccharimonadales bacterium]
MVLAEIWAPHWLIYPLITAVIGGFTSGLIVALAKERQRGVEAVESA